MTTAVSLKQTGTSKHTTIDAIKTIVMDTTAEASQLKNWLASLIHGGMTTLYKAFDEGVSRKTLQPTINAPSATHRVFLEKDFATPGPLLEDVAFSMHVGHERRAYVLAVCHEIRPHDFEIEVLQVTEVGGANLFKLMSPPLIRYNIKHDARISSLDAAFDTVRDWATAYFETNAPDFK